MPEELDGRHDRPPEERGGERLHPTAKVVLQAVSLPVAGIVAACVLVAMGVGLIFVALVLVVAFLAGAVSRPLAALAGRRRIARSRCRDREVVDAAATLRYPDAEDGDEGGRTEGRAP
jgi:hypothetical protein